MESFYYFKKIFPKIDKGEVLDFGFGNSPFLSPNIDDPDNPRFNHQNYTGLDTNQFYIDTSKPIFPQTNFYHIDIKNQVFPTREKFYDFSISYKGLTNCDIDTFFSVIRFMYEQTKKGGYLILNYLDENDKNIVDYYTDLRTREFGSCDDIRTPKWKYLIDNYISYENLPGKYFNLFLNQNYLIKELDGWNIKFKKSYHVIPDTFYSYMFIEKF